MLLLCGASDSSSKYDFHHCGPAHSEKTNESLNISRFVWIFAAEDCHAIGESVWLRAECEMCGDDAGKKILSFGRSSELTFDRLGVERW
jgi:hypothetical protein